MIVYRVLISLFSLAIVVQALWQRDWTSLRARLGRYPNCKIPTIWIHAASNGELTSARPVIQSLRDKRPDLHLLVTANSATGVELARSWGLDAHLAPLDLAWVTKHVLKTCSVIAHITLEKEIWPFRITLCPGPVMVIGGALSAKTARFWSRLPAISTPVFGAMSALSAQSAPARLRYLSLGVPETALLPDLDLKSLYTPPDLAPDTTLRAMFDRQNTWLAASTHKGEDEILIAAHRLACETDPDLRMILVPRHPKRGDDIAELIDAAGFDYARRSLNEPADAPVYLADTMGEMPLWYQLAGRVFIGGTLTDRGGHTPYEPACFDCALIYGPDMHNFETASRKLAEAGIMAQHDSAQIATALGQLRNEEAQRCAAKRARDALQQESDLPSLMEQILALLPLPASCD